MESRRSKRARVFVKVIVEIQDASKQHFNISKKSVVTDLLDISALGIGLSTKYFFPKGIMLKLKFSLPIMAENEDLDLVHFENILGRVCYCISSDAGSMRMGIEFVEIEERLKESISKFVNQNE
jgi:c-di-GMP-binding flagellar brake protein YcgR